MQYSVGDMVRMSNLIGIITKIENSRIQNGHRISHIKHYSVYWFNNGKEWVYFETEAELFTKQNQETT
jgi:hypothetical protein